MPARFGYLSDSQCGKREVVGEELESLLRLHVKIADAAEHFRIRFGGLDGGQNDGMIRANSGSLVDRVRVAALEQDIGFRANHEEGRIQGEHVEALEIHIAAIHDVEGAGFRHDLVEDVDVVYFAIGKAA